MEKKAEREQTGGSFNPLMVRSPMEQLLLGQGKAFLVGREIYHTKKLGVGFWGNFDIGI